MIKKIKLSILIIFLVIIIFLQFNREAECVISNSFTSANEYSEDIIIVANKIVIMDKKEFAEKMIQKCIDNDFKNVLFSYDLRGYPSELHATVYVNDFFRLWNMTDFRFDYVAVDKTKFNYNIKDDSEKYELKIKDQ